MREKIVATTNTDYLFCGDTGIAVQACHALSPEIGQLDRLFHLLVGYLETNGLTQRNLTGIKLVCEEIFVNIVHYSGTEKEIIVLLGHSESLLYVQFIDDGIPFDPLTQPLALTGGEAFDEIKIGGLGIVMIKKISEHAHYERDNNYNNFLVAIRY